MKVFVNYVNTYSASAIAKCFSTSAPGIASLEPEEEEEALENAKNNKVLSFLYAKNNEIRRTLSCLELFWKSKVKSQGSQISTAEL